MRAMLLLLCGLLIAAEPVQPKPVDAVDVDRYMGVWYEVARYENSFQKGMEGVTATYTRKPDGGIKVENAGFEGGLTGERDSSTASAWVVGPGRLKVRFVWPFAADYWIIGLDPAYRWAVVANGDPDYLWLLHRDPHPPAADIAAMHAICTANGRDPAKLRVTAQAQAVP